MAFQQINAVAADHHRAQLVAVHQERVLIIDIGHQLGGEDLGLCHIIHRLAKCFQNGGSARMHLRRGMRMELQRAKLAFDHQ